MISLAPCLLSAATVRGRGGTNLVMHRDSSRKGAVDLDPNGRGAVFHIPCDSARSFGTSQELVVAGPDGSAFHDGFDPTPRHGTELCRGERKPLSVRFSHDAPTDWMLGVLLRRRCERQKQIISHPVDGLNLAHDRRAMR